MSLKKTDMVKHLAKKLDGKMKSAGVPQRFAQGSAAAGAAAVAPRSSPPPAPKLVPLACRLPADLAQRLRQRAVGVEGGMNALLAQALGEWLDAGKAAD